MASENDLIFVANSKLVKNELITFYNVSEKRIILIPNGIKLSDFSKSYNSAANIETLNDVI
jgi:hypothetical protein